MTALEKHDWPPSQSIFEFLASKEVLEFAKTACDRMRGRFPTWAEDAVFDSMTKMFERACVVGPRIFQKFSSKMDFFAYLRTSFRNRAIDYTVRGNRQRFDSASELVESAPDPGLSPLAALLQAEENELTEHKIKNAKLTKREREVMNRILLGMRQATIARSLDLSEGRVSQLVASLTAKLRIC